MSVSREQLIEELRSSREYREAYAESYLNHTLAAQIRLIREQRGLSQKELAVKIGKHSPGYRESRILITASGTSRHCARSPGRWTRACR